LWARRDDQRAGLVFEDQSWTWAEHVSASVDRAAWLLSLRQPGPFHVGVLLDNLPEFSFLLGAAALSEAVIVGLNPTMRGAEMAGAITHTHCQAIITEARYRPLLDGLGLAVPAERIVVIDDGSWPERLAGYEGSTPEQAGLASPGIADPDDLMMLIFTSGTSGRPKAVRCTHRKIAGPGLNLSQRFGLGADDVCYLSMPLFHSNAMLAGWAPALSATATMVFARRFSASGFIGDVRRHGATYFNYVGKPLSYILATPEQAGDADNPLRVAFGNEGADRDLSRFASRYGCEVVDGFGSTEGGVAVTRTPETPVGSIGVPNPGVKIIDAEGLEACPPARFDEHGVLLNPDEAIGELVNTSGAGQFEGYYGDDEADAERMRLGWYWSGDMAYADEKGFYYFAGRALERLRVDGENFGAAPVERVLMRHKDVVLAAVYAVPAADVGDEVMAALVLADGASFDPDQLADFLADQPDLGTKWAPRFVRIAAQLPQTPTNKVLKRVLAAERWGGSDPIWWRPGRELRYEPLGPSDADRLDAALAEVDPLGARAARA
jgi:fatty-acyl-CoA synthase